MRFGSSPQQIDVAQNDLRRTVLPFAATTPAPADIAAVPGTNRPLQLAAARTHPFFSKPIPETVPPEPDAPPAPKPGIPDAVARGVDLLKQVGQRGLPPEFALESFVTGLGTMSISRAAAAKLTETFAVSLQKAAAAQRARTKAIAVPAGTETASGVEQLATRRPEASLAGTSLAEVTSTIPARTEQLLEETPGIDTERQIPDVFRSLVPEGVSPPKADEFLQSQPVRPTEKITTESAIPEPVFGEFGRLTEKEARTEVEEAFEGAIERLNVWQAMISSLDKRLATAKSNPQLRQRRRLLVEAALRTLREVIRAGDQLSGRASLPSFSKLRNAADTGIDGFLSLGPDVLKATGIVAALAPFIEDDNVLVRTADELERGIQARFPGDPARAEELLTGLARAGGVMASFLTGGGAFRGGAKLLARSGSTASLIGNSVAGAARQGVEGFEDAERVGADALARYTAFFLNAGLGVTEAIPIDRFFGRLNQITDNHVTTLLRSTSAQSLEEFTQEVLLSLGSDVIAKSVFDPERDIDVRGALKQGGVGAVIGKALGASPSGVQVVETARGVARDVAHSAAIRRSPTRLIPGFNRAARHIDFHKLFDGTEPGPRGHLKRNMINDKSLELKNLTKWSPHHIVPYQFANHALIRRLGMNINHQDNGIPLGPDGGGTSSPHGGFHEVYNEQFGIFLDRLNRANLTVSAKRALLAEAIAELREDLGLGNH